MAESVHHIQRVDHIEMLVRDVEETLVFYTDVLGFERQRHTIAERPDGSLEVESHLIADVYEHSLGVVPGRGDPVAGTTIASLVGCTDLWHR